MNKLKKVLIILMLLISCASAKTQSEEYKNDFLYSQEYFDYLIECASIKDFELKEEAKKLNKENKEIVQQEIKLDNDSELFKLKVEENDIKKYKQTIKKEDSKTTIRISDKFNVIQDTIKTRNKYNSNDYRLKAGVEYILSDKFMISGGLETNLRGLDQNPISKKAYFSPSVKLNDKLSISFINKMNTLTRASDHDISVNISPFKSNAADFNIYTGYTKYNDGSSSESISFTTNLYFF